MSEKKAVIRLRKLMANKLLARRQMIVDVIHPDQPSVSKDKIKEMIAKKLKVSDSNVVIFGFKVHYGGGKSTGFCLIYDSLQYLLKYEPKHRLRKAQILPKREMTRKQKKDLKFDLILQVKVINGNSMVMESIAVPLNSSILEIEKIINRSLNSDTGGQFQTILYQGKELVKLSQFDLQGLGINENSKFLAINPQSKLNVLSRHTEQQSDGWCYSNGSKDGISFQVSKDVRFAGVGIYTTRDDTEFIVRLIDGKTLEDTVLAEKTLTLNKSEGKIMKCIFAKAVLLRADNLYSIIQVAQKSTNGYYGQGGLKELTGENGIQFTFQNCSGSSNGTDFSRGQVPEIYYYA